MNKYKKLASNSVIFTIGNFGSKLITFLMVPLYTHVLSTGEYGVVDILISTMGLLLPILTLEIGKASIRFAIDAQDEIEQNIIFSNLLLYILIASVLLMILSPILMWVDIFEGYSLYFIVLLVLRLFNNIYSQFIRGIGLVKEYAINGIIMTLVTVLSNIVLLLVYDFRVTGYLVSMIIASFVSNLYMFYISNGLLRIKHFNPNLTVQKKMLSFSLPIVPSAAMWWIVNGSTRYFVLYFVGVAGNGLYAVASKIPSIISMVSNIFTQAWQLSSFEEYQSEDREVFYSKIFNFYWVVMFLLSSLILVIIKPLMLHLIDDAFYLSWTIVPFLLLAVIYEGLSGFYGTIYQASKKTKGTFTTSVYAGLTSIITSIVLVPFIGEIGAGISTAISMFVMFILRVIDTKKILELSINYKQLIITNVIYILQIITLFLFDGYILYLLQIILVGIMLVFHRPALRIFVSKALYQIKA